MNTVVALCCGVSLFLEFMACGLIWQWDTVKLWFLLEGTRQRAGVMIKFNVIWISRLGSCLFKYLNFELAHHSIKPSENASAATDTFFVTIASYEKLQFDTVPFSFTSAMYKVTGIYQHSRLCLLSTVSIPLSNSVHKRRFTKPTLWTMATWERISSFFQFFYNDIWPADIDPLIIHYYEIGLVTGILLTTTLAWFPGMSVRCCHTRVCHWSPLIDTVLR
jgi:hypothetical protein